MMMRSMPPASAHLALMPVPAPPPMMGLPAATWARRRWRHSSRVNWLMVRSLASIIRSNAQLLYGRLEGMPVIPTGTLDPKGVEIQFVRDLLRNGGVETLVIDAAVLGPPHFAPDVPRERVFTAAGTSLEAVRQANDRGKAIEAAAR